jgi:hypothetical protein
MKKFSTVGMAPKEKDLLLGHVLGAFGNENIRGNHIKYFENELLKKNEDKFEDITSAPNYYAWLCLMTEHLFWAMRNFCFQQSEFEHKKLTLIYNELITNFCDTCRNMGVFSESKLKDLFEKAVKVLEIRHAIIHKGFPNLLPIVFENKHVRNKPAITQGGKKERFSEESTRATVKWFSKPSNFHEAKKDFDFLLRAMSSGPGFSIGF